MDERHEAGCGEGATPKGRKRPDPCVMVIFGAEGDLTKRLLTPALYNLARTNSLPEEFALVGVSRGDLSSEQWRATLHESLERFVGSGEIGVCDLGAAAERLEDAALGIHDGDDSRVEGQTCEVHCPRDPAAAKTAGQGRRHRCGHRRPEEPDVLRSARHRSVHA